MSTSLHIKTLIALLALSLVFNVILLKFTQNIEQNPTSTSTPIHSTRSIVQYKSQHRPKPDLTSDLSTLLAALTPDALKDSYNAIESFKKVFPNQKIILGCIESDRRCTEFQNSPNLKVIRWEKGITLGKAWNLLIKEANMYFLLISPKTRFNSFTNLNAMLNGFSWSDASIIGGSFRFMDNGEVQMPCYRITHRRWTLKTQYGYEYSITHAQEPPCVVCGRLYLFG